MVKICKTKSVKNTKKNAKCINKSDRWGAKCLKCPASG